MYKPSNTSQGKSTISLFTFYVVQRKILGFLITYTSASYTLQYTTFSSFYSFPDSITDIFNLLSLIYDQLWINNCNFIEKKSSAQGIIDPSIELLDNIVPHFHSHCIRIVSKQL